MELAGDAIISMSGGDFSISYVDDNKLSISFLHYLWVMYMSGVKRGMHNPKLSYARQSIIDYASSLYYILTDVTGENIIYWAKYWGVFPTNAPESSFSLSKGEHVHTPSITIQYHYSFRKSLDPLILAEFNRNSGGDNGNFSYSPIYNEDTFHSNNTIVGPPFIETSDGGYTYKLRYRDAS